MQIINDEFIFDYEEWVERTTKNYSDDGIPIFPEWTRDKVKGHMLYPATLVKGEAIVARSRSFTSFEELFEKEDISKIYLLVLFDKDEQGLYKIRYGKSEKDI